MMFRRSDSRSGFVYGDPVTVPLPPGQKISQLALDAATKSILSVLPPARAGVGSAVNDATRETGGTLGLVIVLTLPGASPSAHLLGAAPAIE